MVYTLKAKFRTYTKPWAHQLKALRYLYDRDTAALYTDMGTGKSKIMIDLINNKQFKIVLLVCTNKGCGNWEKQFSIHDKSGKVLVKNLAGISSKGKVTALRESINFYKKSDQIRTLVFLCNYEGVWRDPICKEFVKKSTGIDCVICDESHRIKSPSSKCSRFLTKMGKLVKNRYLMTGTPIPENPVDIYAQYRFLDPTIFGTNLTDFRNRYLNIDSQLSARVGFPILDKKEPYKNLDELKEKMFSCAFYDKSSVKLPKRHNILYKFEIDPKTDKEYTKLIKEGVLAYDDGVMSVENALTLSLRQQQLLSGFMTVEDDEGHNTKIELSSERAEALEELLSGLDKDEPVVIFAKFRHDLINIHKVAENLGRGCSEISGEEDTEQDWQSGKTSVLAIQYSSGSESIDLTRARYCVYYSLTYSLALYLQSKKRLHRPGQTRSVTYYHLIAQRKKGKSIDEIVMEALKSKKKVVDYIVDKRNEWT